MAKNLDTKIDEFAKELVAQYQSKEELFGEHGVAHQIQKRILEAALSGELTDHLGYEPSARSKASNARNGYSKKQLKSPSGEIELEVPRDREGSFEPEIVKKGQSRFNGLDDKIIALYARGMSTRDIQAQLQELYSVEISKSLISSVTEAVLEDVIAWQNRPLDRLYPIVFLDCLVVKVREDRRIINKAVYLALGVNLEGQKELLGMWIGQNEGAKFWLSVLTELKNRGLEDIFIACIDGLSGFPEAIETVYPMTKIQLCIVHMVRNSLKYVSWKERKAVAADLKKVYNASTADEAELALMAFCEKWDGKYPSIGKGWQSKWGNIIPFFDYPEDIRKAIYTTNAIESLNMTLRKVIKNKRVFPTDESIYKVLYLAIGNISKRWTMPIRSWRAAMNRFAIEFDERMAE